MDCFGARLGACFCALTAAMGGKGKAESGLPGALAASGGGIGGTRGAGLEACAVGGSGPLPIGGIIDGVGDGAGDAADGEMMGGEIIGGACGGAIGAGRGACRFAADTGRDVESGIDAGEAP